MTLIKIVCTKNVPTLYFLKHDDLEMLILLDGTDHKKIHYRAFDTFKTETIELFCYKI
jgi:hypothetical protein